MTPMAGSHLLDTNIMIALSAQDSGVQQRVNQSNEVFYASIVLGELYFGAQKSGNVERNIQRVDIVAKSATVLACDAETAALYGRLKHELRAKGRPIPDNDIWIAALAVQHNLTLATRDAHFQAVDGLTAEYW